MRSGGLRRRGRRDGDERVERTGIERMGGTGGHIGSGLGLRGVMWSAIGVGGFPKLESEREWEVVGPAGRAGMS